MRHPSEISQLPKSTSCRQWENSAARASRRWATPRKADSNVTLNVGDRIGDYEIVSVLGAGGMGKVYKVRNVISDRVEAMKILLPNLESDPDLADRFMREIKVQGSLD